MTEARKEVDGYMNGGRDYIMHATAQTGGGKYKGPQVATADGSAPRQTGSSWLQTNRLAGLSRKGLAKSKLFL